MRRRIVVIIFTLFISGCTLPDLFHFSSLNTFHVVSYGKNVRHYRGYFPRSELRTLPGKQRYMLLYRPKHRTLAVLLRKKTAYIVYNLGADVSSKTVVRTSKRLSSHRLSRYLSSLGYRRIRPRKFGVVVNVARRKFHGVKTWMIEIKDYSRLKARYLKVLAKGDVKRAKRLAPIPASLIKRELKTYARRSLSANERKTLRILAKRAGVTIFVEKNPKQKTSPKSYEYYLARASEKELAAFLKRPEAKHSLSSLQYRTLSQRLKQLRRDRLIAQGSLDELIEAYRKHKDPLVKRRIMQLLEATQKKRP